MLRRIWEILFPKKRSCCWGPAWWHLGSSWSRLSCSPGIWKQAPHFFLAGWANVLLSSPLCFCVLGRSLCWAALAGAGEAGNLGAATLAVVEPWLREKQSCRELDAIRMQSRLQKRCNEQREHKELGAAAFDIGQSARLSAASPGSSTVLRGRDN